MKPIISFKDFSFKYHAQQEETLKNINLDIYKGEKILILGASGSGKSTLGNCINGLIPFSYPGEITGSLKILNEESKNSSIFKLSKHVGTVLQDSDGQFVGLNVAEDIAFALENENTDQKEMKKIVSEVSKLVKMENHLTSNPHELSGGQKQRVSLAGTLVNDVDILLFDEPLANLDPKTGKTAIELIDEIHKDDKTIIIIEHRLEDVLHKNIDRIILLSDGEIIIDDCPDVVLSSSILEKYGIKEPLYISALKYANIDITKEIKPSSIETIDVSIIKDKLQKWYNDQEVNESKIDKDIVLSIENLSFSYDGIKNVLDNISLDIHNNEMLAIVGKNGAGKSTLSKLIVGFEKEDQGRILLDGKDISNLSIKERSDSIGIILQNPNHMISKNLIFDEIALGLKIRGISDDEIDQRVSEVMKICGLLPFKDWPINALSYGQKKRVTIASILVLNPKILILDEPTAGQDKHHYSEIMNFLKTLNSNGQTIILITHDMHLMLEYTKRAVVLSDSKKLADDDSYKILCDKDLSEKANLKETSLFDLAIKADISDPVKFVSHFINFDQKRRDAL
ncbi:MAG: ABC transporter ATP-binding protein [Anaerorhabdus sp.]